MIQPLRSIAVAIGVSVVALSACGDDEATPIDPSNPPSADFFDPSPQDPANLDPADLDQVVHFFEPTDQMKDAATQQCLDDPELVEGYVKAVNPDDPDVIVSEFAIDCEQARS